MKSFFSVFLLFASIFLSIFLIDTAFSETWEKSIQTTFGEAYIGSGECIEQTNDGGYIIAGTIRNTITSERNIWLVKTDPNGNMAWEKKIRNTGDDIGNWVQQTSDGGYIIVGRTYIIKNISNIYLIKTNADGNQEWSKTFGGAAAAYPSNVQETDDGFIIGGRIFSDDDGFWLIKTNKNGDIIWDSIYRDPRPGPQDMYTLEAWQTTDGGYILLGGEDGADPEYTYLIKFDANGKEQWSKKWTNSSLPAGTYVPYTVKPTKDGGLVSAGSYRIEPSGSTKALAKFDQNGNILWRKNFDSGFNYIEEFLATDDDGVVIFCSDNSYLISKLKIIRKDNNGDLLWTKDFFLGDARVMSESIAETADGGFIILQATSQFFEDPRYQYDNKLIYYKRPERNQTGLNPAIPALLLSD
jgi:hypothetical protein